MTPVPDTTSKCPLRATHTPDPRGYGDWFAWAAKMATTHTQVRCEGCGLLAIWRRRKSPDSGS